MPGAPYTPLAAIAACGFLMFQLPAITWIRFLVWLGIGSVIYATYGYRRSRLRHGEGR